MLTKKQKELLLFIKERLDRDGVPPSYDEMREALDLASKSGIHRLITALEERGFIRRLPHRARALEILRMPDGSVEAGAAREKGFKPNVIEGGGAYIDRATSSIDVPILGKIAAGTPIEAIQHETDRIAVSPDMMGDGEHYVLEIEGDSMVEAGILNGDFAVIRRCDTAQTGEIVVALVDDQEATLKRLRKKGDSIALEAANPAYETRIFGPDRVRVQGRLVSLLRRYN